MYRYRSSSVKGKATWTDGRRLADAAGAEHRGRTGLQLRRKMMRAAFVSIVVFLGLLEVNAMKAPSRVQRRRSVVAAAAAALVAPPLPGEGATGAIATQAEEEVSQAGDWEGRSSAFGMAPPPIQGVLSYEELLDEAAQGRIATVQIAVQHDVVIATTPAGHRFSTYIKDTDFSLLLGDAMRADGSMPFEVLPMNPTHAKVRSAASSLLSLYGILYVADQFDILPWDTTAYSSLAERDEAQEKRARGEAVPTKKPLRDTLERMIAALTHSDNGSKRRHGGSTSLRQRRAPAEKGGRADGVPHDEALRRVLGLASWDAAEELRLKVHPVSCRSPWGPNLMGPQPGRALFPTPLCRCSRTPCIGRLSRRRRT